MNDSFEENFTFSSTSKIQAMENVSFPISAKLLPYFDRLNVANVA